jgi:hypothetical protein
MVVSSELFFTTYLLTTHLSKPQPLPVYKPSTYIVVTYFPTCLPIYETYFLQTWLPRWNQNINSGEVHPQLSNNGHPVEGVLVGCWFTLADLIHKHSTIGIQLETMQLWWPKMHVPSIKCVIGHGWWRNWSGINQMQWPDFPHDGICVQVCIFKNYVIQLC